MTRTAPPWRLMSAGERRRYWLGYWRLGVPALTSLGLLVLMTAPLLLPAPVMPQLGLLSVIVWAVFQPSLMPPWVAFLLGLAADLLFAQPIGLDALLFAVTAVLIQLYRARYSARSHGNDWGLALGLAAAHGVIGWQLLAFAGRPVPFAPQLWQIASTAAAYPAVAWLCARVQQRTFG